MTDPQVAMLMMGSFIFCILLGFPICFTLVAMGFGFGYYAYATPDQLNIQGHWLLADLVSQAVAKRAKDAKKTAE